MSSTLQAMVTGASSIMGAPVASSACQANSSLLSSLLPLTQPERSALGSRASSTMLMDRAFVSRMPWLE